MQHPDEGMIHTWLDGELPAEEAAALEAHVAECARCRASVAEARGFIAASSRIIGTLDNVPSGVIPAAKAKKRVWYSSPQFRAAAAVLIVAGASFLITRTNTQKATLAIPGNAVMADAAIAERIMSAPGAAVAAAPPTAQPSVAASQSPGKKEAAKPVTMAPQPPKTLSVAAPVREMDAAGISPQEIKIANEADFSGKGVKGGAADAATARDFRAAHADLKILRIDNSVLGKRTTYQTSSGREVLLVEQRDESVLSQAVVTGVAESRETAKQSPQVRARQPAAPAPQSAPPPSPTTPHPPPAVRDELAVHSISWVDSATHRRYTLSGSVSVEELQAIRARLVQPKQ